MQGDCEVAMSGTEKSYERERIRRSISDISAAIWVRGRGPRLRLAADTPTRRVADKVTRHCVRRQSLIISSIPTPALGHPVSSTLGAVEKGLTRRHLEAEVTGLGVFGAHVLRCRA